MDYIPPDDDSGYKDLDYAEVKRGAPLRNLWLFVCLVLLPLGLIIGGSVAFNQIRQVSNSKINVAIAELSASSQDLGGELAKTSTVTASATVDSVKPLIVTIRHKDNLNRIFKRVGLDVKSAATILALKKAKALKDLTAGKKLHLVLDSTKTKLQVLEYSLDNLNTLVVTSTSKGGWSVETKHIEPTTNTKYAAAVINGSIYSAGKKAGIPSKIMAQLVNAFGSKISIKNLRNGDKFALFYKEYTVNGQKVKDSEIAAAELVHKGEMHRIISFTDSYGNTNFYTPSGHSIKPAFDRYPVSFKRIGSKFSYARHHPILDVIRPHPGVDLVANTGTPVRAASSGRIAFAGKRGGYGRAVIIKHGIYDTLYAHLSRFSDKVYSGGYVKKGQVIGYVGSSGLSTNPHLHYEFRVNGVPRDPLKVKLPAGEMIPSEHRRNFFAESKRILAQLDLHRKNQAVFAENQASQVK